MQQISFVISITDKNMQYRHPRPFMAVKAGANQNNNKFLLSHNGNQLTLC